MNNRDDLIYLAPMEGITGYIYRNVHHKYFGGVDKYFMPFIAPAKGRPLRNRELRDVLPENNQGINVVPQLLTNSGEGFVKAAKFLKELGYNEVNINLGCPSKTVVTKYKGSGLLYDTERLDNFLYEVFAADVMDVSIKTRIGRDSSVEFEDIIEIYKKYPISELIIHPRIQTDFYKNTPNMEVFAEGVASYGRPDTVCYHGDINSVVDYDRFTGDFPDISKVMIGRGIIADPCLAERIKEECGDSTYDWNRFFIFHDELYRNYCESDVGRGNTMFKMKELWAYWSRLGTGIFPETQRQEGLDSPDSAICISGVGAGDRILPATGKVQTWHEAGGKLLAGCSALYDILHSDSRAWKIPTASCIQSEQR